MKNKRFANTMIAAASTFCIAMTGLLPVQAAEGTSIHEAPADYIPRAAGGRVNVATYGNVAVSVSQDNGKTVMSIRAADTTAAKESNSDITGNTSGSNGTAPENNNNPPEVLQSLLKPQPKQAELAPESVSKSLKNTGNQNGDQNIAVSVGGKTYYGNTDIQLGKGQKVNFVAQDDNDLNIDIVGNNTIEGGSDGALLFGIVTLNDLNLAGDGSMTISSETAGTTTPNDIQLSQAETGKLCGQLFIVQGKNVIINLTWYETNINKPEMAGNLANLKQFTKDSNYNFYGIDLPVNSITTTSEAYKEFMSRLSAIQVEQSEAAHKGSDINVQSTGGVAVPAKDGLTGEKQTDG
jgi:hypothetical protein